MSGKIVYLNGEYLPVDEARVSVLDRGFLYGDGVYEVIPVYGTNMLRVNQHIERLKNSLSRISLRSPFSEQEWIGIFDRILELNPGGDRSIYLQITRGVYPARDLKTENNSSPTIFVMVMPINAVAVEELRKGIEAITLEDFRWHACDIKSISLIANVMMREQAKVANVVDAILLRDGFVTEGTASNVFIVKDNVVITPPKSKHLLPGITRDLVIELAEANSIKCEVRDIKSDELINADEIWMTSSTREIAPVIILDKKPVANGKVGPVWGTMMAIYQDYKNQLRQAHE